MSDVHGELTHPEDGLVRAWEEVVVPARTELGTECLELLGSRTHLHTTVDAVVCEDRLAILVPVVCVCLKCGRVVADDKVESVGVVGCVVGDENDVMICCDD